MIVSKKSLSMFSGVPHVTYTAIKEEGATRSVDACVWWRERNNRNYCFVAVVKEQCLLSQD